MKSPFGCAVTRLLAAACCAGSFPAASAWCAATFENEGIRVEFLEIGAVTAPNVDVPLRFRVENRSSVRIGGRLDIGGPTRGILPRKEPSHAFQVEPNGKTEFELAVAFAEDCVDGLYPVHAFFLLEEGRGDRGKLTRFVRPGFAAQARGTAEPPAPRVASFRPGEVENAIDRFFEEKRLSVMADYARSLDRDAGRAFRLGQEEGAYRVILASGRQGLLDGYLYFSGPKGDLYFRGLRVAMRAPAGVEIPDVIEVGEWREESRENGMFVSHHVKLGEWESILNVEVAVEQGEVKIRCESPDPVVEVSLGEASRLPAGLTAGMGYRFAHPDSVNLGRESALLDVRHAEFDFDRGVRVTMGSDDPLRAIRVIRSEHHASVAVAGGRWLRVIPCVEGGPRPPSQPSSEPASTGNSRKVPVCWFRRSSRDLASLEGEIKEWGRCQAEPAGLILDGWQWGGQEPVPPDVWPPNEETGGIQRLVRFAEVCRQSKVTLVLNDRYDEISPAARGFRFDVVEFGADRRPVELRPGATYALRPDAAVAFLGENWKQIEFYLKPGGAFLGGVDATGHEFWDGEGRHYPAEWTRERWQSNAGAIRKQAGESTLILADGGGDWLSGRVDALVASRPTDLPPGFSRVPWWILFEGERTPVIEKFVEDASGSPLSRLSERVADGRLPLFGEETWLHEALERSWFFGPVFRRFSGRKVEGIRRETDGKHLTVDWGGGLTVRRNGDDKPWSVAGKVLPPGGYWVEDAGLQGGMEEVSGVTCETLVTPEELCVRPACEQRRPVPLQLSVDSLRQVSGDRVELAISWRRPELIPPGSSLRFYLSGPGERGMEAPWGDEGLKLGDTAPATVELPAAGVAVDRDWEVSVAIENAGRRRLRLLSATGTGSGEDPGLVRVGRLRKGEGEVPRWEATWRTAEEWPGTGGQPPPPLDFDWGVAPGAFRLKKSSDRWQLFSLACEGEFEVKLRPSRVEGFPAEIAMVLAWPRKGEGAKEVPFRTEEGFLVLKVQPEILVYDFLNPAAAEAFAAASAAAQAAEAAKAPNTEAPKPATGQAAEPQPGPGEESNRKPAAKP